MRTTNEKQNAGFLAAAFEKITVRKARALLCEKMKAAGLNPRKDFWTWSDDKRWWEVQVPALGLHGWVYADSSAHAKNICAVDWMEADQADIAKAKSAEAAYTAAVAALAKHIVDIVKEDADNIEDEEWTAEEYVGDAMQQINDEVKKQLGERNAE